MGTHLDIDDVAAGHPLAQQELAELRKDAERLNWISENGYAVRGKGNGKKNILLWMDRAEIPGYPTSLRAAVDAAMKGANTQ